MNTIRMRIGKCLRRAAALLALAATLFVPLAPKANAGSGDVFIVGLVSAAGAALNPLVCTQRDFISLNELVFESVITLDDNLQPTGELALQWNYEGKNEYTFHLRKNVRFHDGSNLTAYDVYATYSHILRLGESNSPYYTRCRYIDQMEVADDYTLKVTGKYDSYLTLYAMTFPVLQPDTLDWDMACGTGPYWYMNYEADWIQIDANPYWWKVSPVFSTIYGYRYDETGDALKALSTGEIDALATRSQTAALGRLLADRTSVDYTTLTYEMLIPNIKKTLFSNAYTRQALMYAIDIPTIASNVYMDMVTKSEVPVVPGSWLYEPQSAVYYPSKERALQLLKQAGWGDYNEDGILDQIVDGVLEQFEFTLTTYVDDAAATRTHAAELIRDELRELGISVTVSTVSKSSIQKKLKNADFDMVLGGINLSVLPDLTFLLNSNGRMNYSGYSSVDMNTWLTNIYDEADESMFRLWYSKIQLQISQDLPFLGLFFRRGTMMTTADVIGFSAVLETDALRGIEYVTFQ